LLAQEIPPQTGIGNSTAPFSRRFPLFLVTRIALDGLNA